MGATPILKVKPPPPPAPIHLPSMQRTTGIGFGPIIFLLIVGACFVAALALRTLT